MNTFGQFCLFSLFLGIAFPGQAGEGGKENWLKFYQPKLLKEALKSRAGAQALSAEANGAATAYVMMLDEALRNHPPKECVFSLMMGLSAFLLQEDEIRLVISYLGEPEKVGDRINDCLFCPSFGVLKEQGQRVVPVLLEELPGFKAESIAFKRGAWLLYELWRVPKVMEWIESPKCRLSNDQREFMEKQKGVFEKLEKAEGENPKDDREVRPKRDKE